MPESKNKTILQVVPALVSGGVERGTIDIAIELKNRGYDSIVVSNGGYLAFKLEEAGIKHIKMNVASKNPFVIWKNAKLIASTIKDYKIDIVHARSRAPAWSCYMATRATGAKFITTFHGIYKISWWLKRYYNSIMVEGEKIIAVSNFVKQHIIQNYKVDINKIRVIHRGVDSNYFDPKAINNEQKLKFLAKYNVPQDTPVILLPSRMTEWKGQLVLIEALNQIKHLNFYCLMVGDISRHPNFVKRVRDLIQDYKLQSKIQIFGNEAEMIKLYSISDIVLSTSIEPEAFGRTIIEGQAMEKIVIASNIGGAAETVENNINGYHVAANDSKSLADKIQYCLSILGTKEATTIEKAARKSAIKNFSLEAMLKKTLVVYSE